MPRSRKRVTVTGKLEQLHKFCFLSAPESSLLLNAAARAFFLVGSVLLTQIRRLHWSHLGCLFGINVYVSMYMYMYIYVYVSMYMQGVQNFRP